MRKLQIKNCRESLISRIPGLFAYIDWNDAGISSLHKATDSLEGCYGKVIADIKIPSGKGTSILPAGTYSYRTIIDYYYKYREELGENDPFISFVNKGIGKIKVDFSGYSEEKYDLCPTYIHLANAKRLYAEYSLISYKCRFYKTRQTKDDEENDELCCLCRKYDRMGGDTMKNWLKSKISEAETIAKEYNGYASEKTTSLDIHVNLVSTENDMGILSCYLNPWVGGAAHFNGELVTYDGSTYRYKGTTGKDKYNEEEERFYNPSETANDYYEKLGGYKFDGIGDGIEITGSADSKLKSLRCFTTYMSANNELETPAEDKDWLYFYREGVVTDYSTINDSFGNIQLIGGVSSGGEYETNLMAYGNVITDISLDTANRTITFTYVLNGHLKAKLAKTGKDDDGNELRMYDKFVLDTDSANGKYQGVTYKETYTYDAGDTISTTFVEPLLFNKSGHGLTVGKSIYLFYKTGSETIWNKKQVNVRSLGDFDGNSPTAYFRLPNNTLYNPKNYSFGYSLNNTDTPDFTDITYVEPSSMLFTMGSKLNEDEDIYVFFNSDTERTEDTVKVYKLGDYDGSGTTSYFQINGRDIEGKSPYIVSSYIRLDGENELYKLSLDMDKFEKYVTEEPTINSFEKYEFNLDGALVMAEYNTPTDTSSAGYIISEFSTNVKNSYDYLYAQVFKHDYLMGITYNPQVDSEIFIERGNAAAFEKHIKLSEVKTLEDMENYANGSFFNIQSVT